MYYIIKKSNFFLKNHLSNNGLEIISNVSWDKRLWGTKETSNYKSNLPLFFTQKIPILDKNTLTFFLQK